MVGQGDINFYLFSQNHYETYVSQFGFAFASELFEHVTTVSFEHEFSSTTGWWIVVENDYSDNVTIDLRVDLYSWTDPTTGTIPGFPGGSILIGIFIALLAIIIIRRKRTE